MKILCKKCGIGLTQDLEELKGLSLLDENDEKDFLPVAYYFISNGDFFTDSTSKIITNLKDLKNVKYHSDSSRLSGCCGPSGIDGLNKVCLNGHEIGTAKEDCWMPHCLIFESELIIVD